MVPPSSESNPGLQVHAESINEDDLLEWRIFCIRSTTMRSSLLPHSEYPQADVCDVLRCHFRA